MGKIKMGRRSVRTWAIATAIVGLIAMASVAADAQGLSAGAKGGLPTPAIGGFTEVFLSPSWSVSLGVGVQSASATIATWSTVYLAGPRQPIAPYVGAGVRAVLTQPSQLQLMALGGVRAQLPGIAPLSVRLEAAVLPRLPDLGRIPFQGRVAVAYRF